MSSRKISDMLLLPTPMGLEQTVVAVNGVNYRVTLNAIKSLVTKADLGLGNVDNTSDMGKPISTLMLTALNNKSDTSHSHSISDVVGLIQYITDQLSILAASMASLGHTHQVSDILDLVNQLNNKVNINDLTAISISIDNLNTALLNKTNIGHSHTSNDISDFVTEVQNIVNAMGFGTLLNVVTIGDIQW
jgi:hypothetical protein